MGARVAAALLSPRPCAACPGSGGSGQPDARLAGEAGKGERNTCVGQAWKKHDWGGVLYIREQTIQCISRQTWSTPQERQRQAIDIRRVENAPTDDTRSPSGRGGSDRRTCFHAGNKRTSWTHLHSRGREGSRSTKRPVVPHLGQELPAAARLDAAAAITDSPHAPQNGVLVLEAGDLLRVPDARLRPSSD